MTPTEIKTECSTIYQTIAQNQARLKVLREMCSHEKTTECNYEWRVGSIFRTLVCESCGECVKNLDAEVIKDLKIEWFLGETTDEQTKESLARHQKEQSE